MTMIMTKATMDNFLKNGKGLLLAYDQGFEHGPSTDFNEKNIDPNYVLDIAVKGQFTGVVLHKGIAEKYYNSKIPLIIKLNGKTSLPKGEPISSQVCSVSASEPKESDIPSTWGAPTRILCYKNLARFKKTRMRREYQLLHGSILEEKL